MTDRTDWQARRRTWKVERLDPALARAPEREPAFRTLGEIELEPVYGPWSAPDGDLDAAANRVGMPGEAPFTRGIHPSGYRSRLWTMRMFAGFGAAEDTNRRFKDLLAAGQTGLSIAYDMPTLYGYDTDDPEAEGEFGTCGVGVSSLADMEVLLEGLPLDKVSTSMTINSPAAPIWAMYIVAAEKAGIEDFLVQGGVRFTTVTLVGSLVYWAVNLTVVLAALTVLGIETAGATINRLVLHVPAVITAVVVLILGTLLGQFVGALTHAYLANLGVAGARAIAAIARWAVVVFVIALSLEQLSIGGQVLVSAFQIAFGALCLALALAFGLGGREWAARVLDSFLKK